MAKISDLNFSEPRVSNLTILAHACHRVIDLASPTDKFIHRPEWGTLDFNEARQAIEMIVWIAAEIRRLPLEDLPERAVERTTNELFSVHDSFRAISSFSLDEEGAQERRKELLDSVKKAANRLLAISSRWLPAYSLRFPPHDSIQNLRKNVEMAKEIYDNAQQFADSSKSKVNEALEQVAQSQSRIDKAAAAAAEAAGKAGGAAFTRRFEEEAKKYKWVGGWWLVATGGLMVVTGVAAWSLLEHHSIFTSYDQPWFAILSFISGRLVLISLLFIASIWSGRIALANMHLSAVNRHRATSIQTLQAFLAAATDGAARDAVVMEAARAVYENVPTGYLAKEGTDRGGGASRTVELVKSVSDGKKSSS